MAYIPDLSNFENVRYVGYLSFAHVYSKGEVADPFFERLVALILQRPRWVSAGYHSCDLGWCGVKRAFSFRFHLERPFLSFPDPPCTYLESYGRTQIGGHNGRLLGAHEIEVASGDIIYCAPSLILHYVLDHDYKPPDEFCKAVLNSRKNSLQTSPERHGADRLKSRVAPASQAKV